MSKLQIKREIRTRLVEEHAKNPDNISTNDAIDEFVKTLNDEVEKEFQKLVKEGKVEDEEDFDEWAYKDLKE